MNHSTSKQQNTGQEGKRFLLTLSLFMLAAVFAGIFSIWHTQKTESSAEQETLPTEAETTTLETNLPAAASAQTEISDMISEPAAQEVPAAITVTEIITEPSVITETFTEISIPAETQAPAPAEPFPTPEYETLLTPDETAPEAVSTLPLQQETVTEPVSETEETTAAEPQEQSYRSVLETILKSHAFQNERFDVLNDSDIAENEFAVYDINNDGEEELIIRWSNTTSASVMGVIYGHDSDGNIYCELQTTPYLRFYSNGIIEADSAHNSARAGEHFWTYTLYQYDTASKTYQQAGYVDAWDKSALEEAEDTQETFPDYADVSHSGMVYFISCSDEENASGFSDPLDITEYQAWHTSFIGGASELSLPYQKFTEQNIAAIE